MKYQAVSGMISCKDDQKVLEFIDSASRRELIELIRLAKFYHAAEFRKEHLEHAEWVLERKEAEQHVHKQTIVAWLALAVSVAALFVSVYFRNGN